MEIKKINISKVKEKLIRPDSLNKPKQVITGKESQLYKKLEHSVPLVKTKGNRIDVYI